MLNVSVVCGVGALLRSGSVGVGIPGRREGAVAIVGRTCGVKIVPVACGRVCASTLSRGRTVGAGNDPRGCGSVVIVGGLIGAARSGALSRTGTVDPIYARRGRRSVGIADRLIGAARNGPLSRGRTVGPCGHSRRRLLVIGVPRRRNYPAGAFSVCRCVVNGVGANPLAGYNPTTLKDTGLRGSSDWRLASVYFHILSGIGFRCGFVLNL